MDLLVRLLEEVKWTCYPLELKYLKHFKLLPSQLAYLVRNVAGVNKSQID